MLTAVPLQLIDGTSYKRFVLQKALKDSDLSISAKEEDTSPKPITEIEPKTAAASSALTLTATEDEAEIKRNKQRLHGFYHYSKTMDQVMDKSGADVMEIGAVYLMGTIGETGAEFGHESVIKGLREAANDKKIKAVVLRVDSGGGGVIERSVQQWA